MTRHSPDSFFLWQSFFSVPSLSFMSWLARFVNFLSPCMPWIHSLSLLSPLLSRLAFPEAQLTAAPARCIPHLFLTCEEVDFDQV